jgi:hypothetical protein
LGAVGGKDIVTLICRSTLRHEADNANVSPPFRDDRAAELQGSRNEVEEAVAKKRREKTDAGVGTARGRFCHR